MKDFFIKYLIPVLLGGFAIWGSIFLIVLGIQIVRDWKILEEAKIDLKDLKREKKNILLKDSVVFILLALFLLSAIFVLKRLGIFHV